MKHVLLIAAAILAVPPQAQAVLADYGVAEGVSLRSCIAGQTGCDEAVRPPFALQFGGLPTETTAQAHVESGSSSASARVSLSGMIGAPILSATAHGAAAVRANTTSFALQRYTYTGASPDTRTFSATLTYAQALSGVYPPPDGSGIYAAIELFTLPVSMIDFGDTAESNFGAIFGVSTLPGYASLGSQAFHDQDSVANGRTTLAVTHTLQPGDAVWVFTLLQTPAPNESTIDASHTMITQWDNPANLMPAAVVPEPAIWAELAAGLTALAGLRRRRIGRGRHQSFRRS